ncbi:MULTISPECIES: beta-propeller fold lactonase family protein [unclassified Spirosoma]|uniref:beta-propeller fold lactonase family protein n=1 Tax=unclassified Spirosoma TaxID=2621999 RepID=UPI00096707C0|nr:MULTISPECIES: beta-propeller fold lactonase family protein [unclassified Spirosoma]MBN8822314.1 beta-propeller fold lactonase family protein [Spirosoma sp.]OJW72385.1 MAG: phosphoesterase [Spirosoma sp. 48-14]
MNTYFTSLLYWLVTLFLCVLLQGCRHSLSPSSGYGPSAYKTATDDSTLYNLKSPFLMPYNRIIDAAGQSVSFGDASQENHSLDAVLLPDGKTLAVEDRYGVAFFDARAHQLISRWEYAKVSNLRGSMSSFSGIKAIVHHDSTYIFWGAGGRGKPNSYVVQAVWDGSRARLVRTIPFEPLAPATIALPNEVAVREESGELYLYTVLNGNNQLVKIRVRDQHTIWTASTGVAPYGLTLLGQKAYVTNWAGPVPDLTNGFETAGVPWGSAYVDPKTGAMARGTVSVIELQQGRPETELSVGLHPNAIISSPDGRFLYVANGNSDYVSVIDAQKQQVTDSIFVGLFNRGNGYIGSTPNALAIDPQGTTLYVANGMDNAVCVVSLGKTASTNGKGNHQIKGYIPTQAYPSGLVLNNGELYVTNLEAIGPRIANPVDQGGQGGKLNKKELSAFNSHKQLASISFIPLPTESQLNAYTEKVKQQSLQFRLSLTEQAPRPNVAPRPVPERIGEPSVFKHVLYIIKENRTYDQVLGDMPEGKGMPDLCIFGDSVTPNQHRIARDYLLMDNYHVSGKSSAEGHHWASAAMVTDYTEKNVRAWFRSYPHVLYDALVYDKKGLIWNNALDHGKTVRLYGEACTCHFDSKQYNWKNLYQMRQESKPFSYTNTTTISRIRPYLSMDFPGCDDENISDQMRADAFIKELKEIEANPNADLPNLMVMSLPNDHTSGLNPAFPVPRAMVADNDLAVGRIVDAITHSRFAASTVIFITEDDSQAGWDHMSAYRTTGYIVSQYSRLKKTVHTNYNQTSMVRTMEQILGLPPMNVIDATALPMFDCFTDQPDRSFTYKVQPNRVNLAEMNPSPTGLKGPALRFANQSIKHGFYQIDRGHDDLLNRILWFAAKGKKRYPAELAGAEEEDDDDD